jgi:hypothetical protein
MLDGADHDAEQELSSSVPMQIPSSLRLNVRLRSAAGPLPW